MREIKFRGKHIITGTWMYGYLLGEETIGEVMRILGDDAVERPQIVQHCQIDKKTVGQYTGLKDKNGKEIYEGDLIKFTEIDEDSCFGREDTEVVEVKWIEEIAQYRAVFKSGRRTELHFVVQLPTVSSCEIIGNIYENSELLK